MGTKKVNLNQTSKIRMLSRHLARKLTTNETKVISGSECRYSASVTANTLNSDQSDNPGFICD